LSKSETEGFFVEVRVDIAFGLSIVPIVALLWLPLRRQKLGNIFLSKIFAVETEVYTLLMSP
jgi:hypothetical protein